LCTAQAADLNGQIIYARDSVLRVRAGVPLLGDAG
jgi:hypothetical protein